MTQVILDARLSAITAVLAALATADALRRVELLAEVQQLVGLALRWSVIEARKEHTLRAVADVMGLPHSVLYRQVASGAGLQARRGRTYHAATSRNALPRPSQLARAS